MHIMKIKRVLALVLLLAGAGLALSSIPAVAASGRLYVTGVSPTHHGVVWVIDADTGTQLAQIDMDSNPQNILLTPDGHLGFVLMQIFGSHDSNVAVIDIETHTVIAGLEIGRTPVAMALAPDGAKLYVLNRTGGSPGGTSITRTRLFVIDVSTLSITAAIPVPSAYEPPSCAAPRSKLPRVGRARGVRERPPAAGSLAGRLLSRNRCTGLTL